MNRFHSPSTSPFVIQPFPHFSEVLSLQDQQLLSDLEHTLSCPDPLKMLITVEPRQNKTLVLACIEALLYATRSQHMLVLTSSSFESQFSMGWHLDRSLINEQPFCSLFPTAYAPLWPPRWDTRVYISTIREMQLQQIRSASQICSFFDLILVLDFPGLLSPVWMSVLEQLAGLPLIAFSGKARSISVTEWFGGNLLSRDEPVFSHKEVKE